MAQRYMSWHGYLADITTFQFQFRTPTVQYSNESINGCQILRWYSVRFTECIISRFSFSFSIERWNQIQTFCRHINVGGLYHMSCWLKPHDSILNFFPLAAVSIFSIHNLLVCQIWSLENWNRLWLWDGFSWNYYIVDVNNRNKGHPMPLPLKK